MDPVSAIDRKDHVNKFKSTLKSLTNIYRIYIQNRVDCGATRGWKIRHTNGVYRILRPPTHWVYVSDEIVEGIRPMGFLSEEFRAIGFSSEDFNKGFRDDPVPDWFR